MAKYLRYSAALASKVYLEIVMQAELRLADHGTFSKHEVVKDSGFEPFESEIRWDYVRRMIEEKHDTELIPLAPSYYRRHSKQEELEFTEKFVAKGNGRHTVGYCVASERNGHFVIHRLELKMRMANAFIESAERTRSLGLRVGALKPPAGSARPRLIEDDTEPDAEAS